MLFRFTCRQCACSYYPWSGPTTLCPDCLAEPEPSGLQVFAWLAVASLLLGGLVYLTIGNHSPASREVYRVIQPSLETVSE